MSVATISNEDFRKLIAKRARTLLNASYYLVHQKTAQKALTRPLVGEFLSQATQIEELLDAYGSRNNQKWHIFRLLTATIKLFSNVSYELLHIQHALPAYRLLPVGQDFVKATEQTLSFTGSVLLRTSEQILQQAEQLDLPCKSPERRKGNYTEQLPPGRLAQDYITRKTESVSKTVTLLSTAFLNLAAESKQVLPAGLIQPQDYTGAMPGPISEENLRSLELRFHNLQSLYDTYVSKTEMEELDEDLIVLRGHISVVFHLLRVATEFAHYYERHVDKQHEILPSQQPLVKAEELLTLLTSYSINFVCQYLTCAELLCQNMLKRYAEMGEIEVSVPQYRGFHVRPSTLISKLVLHYGSAVEMELVNERYDASSPLELFRANEVINAQKRRWLAEEIVHLNLVPECSADNNIKSVVRNVILTLAERSKLVIYEHPLHLEEKIPQKQTKLLEQVTDEIARLQVTGKIDIGTDLKVCFIGDKRVLDDIKLLAESGYGEDNFGNNIPLPKDLTYLRQQTWL
jgi:hypothetical protein